MKILSGLFVLTIASVFSNLCPFSIVNCSLPESMLITSIGGEIEALGAEDECTHNIDDRTRTKCTWADGTLCNTSQNIFNYHDDTEHPNRKLEDHTYCIIGAKCVNVEGSKGSGNCTAPLAPVEDVLF